MANWTVFKIKQEIQYLLLKQSKFKEFEVKIMIIIFFPIDH